MISRLVKRISADAGGSSLVEFSLVSVMLVLLLLGVVEISRMVLVYTAIANATRAGARYAIVHGSDRTGSGVDGPSGSGDYSQVRTVVRNFAGAAPLDTSKLTDARITVTYSPSNTPGSNVTVKVTYPYDPWVNYFVPLGSVTLSSMSRGVITY
jgi:Flp pilus assembly protein TadG